MPTTVNITTVATTTQVDVYEGRDAYQIAVAEGFVGTRAEWLASLSAADPNAVVVASPANDDMIQRVGGSWVTRTIAQIKTALGLGSAAYTASTDYSPAVVLVTGNITLEDGKVYHNASGSNTYTPPATQVLGKGFEIFVAAGDVIVSAVPGYPPHPSFYLPAGFSSKFVWDGTDYVTTLFKGYSSGTNSGNQDLTPYVRRDSNLSSLDNIVTARSNLGLGSAATTDASAYATAAQGTNSREWTASTVDQAEAEAGVATTRRAWTAERVRQGIVAWWATVSANIARTDAANTFSGPQAFSSTTRPTSSATGLPEAGSLMLRSDCDTRYGPVVSGYMSADQILTSTTTFTDLTGLSVDLAVGVWRIEVMLPLYMGDAAMGVKVQPVFSGTEAYNRALYFYGGYSYPHLSFAGLKNETSSSSFVWAAPAGDNYYLFQSTISVTVAGTFKLQGAQYTSSAAPLYFRNGSSLVARKIA